MATPHYTTITRIEIGLLLEHKAPRCCFPVISAINSYMFDTFNSFPSVKTIIEWCGGHISKSGVEKALRWLEKHNIIVRGKAKTRSRFTNMIRKKVYGTVEKGKKCLQSVSKVTLTECKHKENKPKENNSTPFIPPDKHGETKRQRKRSVESRLQRAKRRVQNYQNLLNNSSAETRTEEKKAFDETRGLFSYWLCLVQLGHKNQVKATEEQKKDLRKLLAIDPDVKEQFDHAKTLQSVLNL
jgi:hypothetical protein